jgi:hypothetical protein
MDPRLFPRMGGLLPSQALYRSAVINRDFSPAVPETFAMVDGPWSGGRG